MVIDGEKIAKEILDRVTAEVLKLPFRPVFCDVLVGDDPVSKQYIKMKAVAAEKVGMKFLKAEFPENIQTQELIKEIQKINLHPDICGLIVQLPLPPYLDTQAVLDSIDPKIDVDCIGKTNSDLFFENKSLIVFPTVSAIMEILKSTGQEFLGKQFLVVGYGKLVGRPLSYLLEAQGFSCTVARSTTENMDELMKDADVIISATGQPNLITADKIKPGCTVIDAGTSEATTGAIVGDVDFKSVSLVASHISPVPGGVGPVTVACLLENVLKVAKSKS